MAGTGNPENSPIRIMAQAIDEAQAAKRRLYLGVAGALVVVILTGFGANWYAGRQRKNADQAARAAAEATGRAKILAEEAQAADGRARLASAQRDAVAQEVARLRKKLAETPLPEPAKPAPAGDAELTAGLQARGVLTPLPRIEAVQVWNWSEEALRVPQLTLRLDAAEAVIKGQDMDITSLKGLAEAEAAAKEKWRSAHVAQSDRGDALDRQVKALQKEAKAREVKWWIKLGAGVAASYVVGRATR